MIYQCIPYAFKSELMLGTHVFGTDVIKMALYTSNAVLDTSTTAYTATGEVSDPNYTPGGIALTVSAPISIEGGAYITINDAVYGSVGSPVAVTARGALIYNSSKSDKAILVLDFGNNYSSVITFTVRFPSGDLFTPILRIA